MNKATLGLIALLGIAAVGAFAQAEDAVPAGTFGINASVSDYSNSIGGFYYVTPTFIVAPEVYFYKTNTTYSSVTTEYPDTYFSLGSGFYYELTPFDALSFDIGPAVSFANEKYTSTSTNAEYTYSRFTLRGDCIAKVKLTRNVSIFSTFGVYLYSNSTNNTTSSTETKKTGFALQSAVLGVAYYFR